MKSAIRPLIATALMAVLFSGTTFAVEATPQSIRADLNAAMLNGGSNIGVSVVDDVTTLFGHVEDEIAKRKVERVVAASPGVERVVNAITAH